jgi:phage-related protein
MKVVRYLFDGWYEIRVRGNLEVRIFFVFKEQEILILHGYIKKTQKLLLRELYTAQQRLKQSTK